MVSYDDLFQVCAKYTAPDFFVGAVIPEKKLVNARNRYPVPDRERIVALLDTTVFGSAKTGLAIGETGLHWRNASAETSRTYMSWREFASVPLTPKGVMPPKIEMGKGVAVELSSGGLSKKDAAKLLADLQHLARSPSTDAPVSIGNTGERWMLAMGGQQFGPYGLNTVQDMVTKGQIDAKECWAWKERMPNWERFTQVPALAALLRDATRPPTLPPPLPTSVPPSPKAPRARGEVPQDSAHSAPRNRGVSYDELFGVCVKYSGDGYYVGEAIPQKKLANARASFTIPDTERVVALLDTTVFGSNKDGLAVCAGGVYWHDMMSDPNKLPWAEFTFADIKPKGNRDLEIGENNVPQATFAMDRDDALRLLLEIQAMIRSKSSTEGATEAPVNQGMQEKAEAIPSRWPAARDTATQVPSRLDLNLAPVDDLLSLPAISLPNGQKLVRERERRAGFDTVEEAGHFLGLQPHQVERLKQRVTLEPYKGARPSSGRIIDF